MSEVKIINIDNDPVVNPGTVLYGVTPEGLDVTHTAAQLAEANFAQNGIVTVGSTFLDAMLRTYTFGSWQWRIDGIVKTPATYETDTIPEELEGESRAYIVVGKADSTFQVIAGDASEIAIDPVTPVGTVYLTRFVVTGAVIGEPETPILGSDYVKKAYSNRHSIYTGLVAGVYPLPEDGRTAFVIEAGPFTLSGFSIPVEHEHLYEGKIFYLQNTSGASITLEHDGVADVWFNLPGAADYVFETSEEKTLMFKFSYEEGLTWVNQGGESAPSLFLGKYTTLGALETAHPTAIYGSYAIVDPGTGVEALEYIWDDEEGWVSGGSVGPSTTDALPEGGSNLYFTVARVLATVLSGISFATGGAVVSTDTVLQAFGKLQKQIIDLVTALSGKQDTLVSGTNLRTVNGETLLGSTNLVVNGKYQYIRTYLPNPNFATINVWYGYNNFASTMLTQNFNVSNGTGTEPTKLLTWFADNSVFLLKNCKKLNKLYYHHRTCGSTQTIQLYVVVGDYINSRGQETNGQIIVNTTFSAVNSNSVNIDIPIIAHADFNANSVMYIFMRCTTGTVTINNMQKIFEFENI